MSDPGTDVAVADAAELAALQAAQDTELADAGLFQTPILKIGEALTTEVKAGDAEAGELINTVTGDVYGTSVDFIVAYYQRGRFASDRKTNRAYVAFGDTIPEPWADLVGEEFVGTAFTEYPDAEEKYKERVNAKEIEWGHGPLISTTHNFTGFVLAQEEGGEAELQPVRLSLKRTNVPSVRKIMTIKRASLRNKPFWDKVFKFTTREKDFSGNQSHVLDVKLGRDTTPDEKAAATELALATQGGRTVSNEAEADAPAEAPEAKGGLAV